MATSELSTRKPQRSAISISNKPVTPDSSPEAEDRIYLAHKHGTLSFFFY